MGHIVGADEIHADSEEIRAITEMPSQTDVTSARRFLGLINYLVKFVPHMAVVVRQIQAYMVDFML